MSDSRIGPTKDNNGVKVWIEHSGGAVNREWLIGERLQSPGRAVIGPSVDRIQIDQATMKARFDRSGNPPAPRLSIRIKLQLVCLTNTVTTAPGHAAAADGGGYPTSDLVGALAVDRDNNAGGFETACSRRRASGGRSDIQPPFRLTRAFEETKEPSAAKLDGFSPADQRVVQRSGSRFGRLPDELMFLGLAIYWQDSRL